jgi:hypothetical protein
MSPVFSSVRTLRLPWSIGLGLGALALWLWTVSTARFSTMDSYGLVSVVHGPFFLGLALLAGGLALEVQRVVPHTGRMLFLTLVLVLFLFGTACAIEPVSALYDSWLHSGFSQYIIDHGHSLNGFDARFSWPGAFSLAAVVASFAGQHDTLGFIRWFPLFIEGLYLAPLLTIARFSGVDRRTAWFGVVLFYSTNWIYQDYFSPQALNYLFFLVVIGVALALWQPRRGSHSARGTSVLAVRVAQTRAALTRARVAGRDTIDTYPSAVTIVLVLVLGLILLAAAMSHQLTPYALLVALAMLLLSRRLGRPEIIVLGGLFAAGWLSLGASNYWAGHLNAIFGSVGQLGNTLSANVTNRITGAASHRFVVDARILDVVVLYGLGVVGTLRRAGTTRTLELLTASPFLLIAAQDYGGEGLLRVVLFGLPFVSVLAASSLLPTEVGPISPLVPKQWLGWFARPGQGIQRVAIALVIVGFASATFVVRGGNDAFESFSAGELAAAQYTYDHAHAGQAIWLATPFMPVEFKNVNTNPVEIAAYQVTSGNPTRQQVLFTLISNNAKWIILGKSEAAWGTDVAGYPPGWMGPFTTQLKRSGFRVVARWPTATVMHLGPLAP